MYISTDRRESLSDPGFAVLGAGDTIRVADLTLPEGVSIDLDPEFSLVVGQPPQVSEADLVTEEETAEGEAAEAAAAEAAEGEGAEGEAGAGDQPAGEDASA